MTKHYFKFLFLLLFVNQLLAQQKNLWLGIDETKIENRQLQLKHQVKKYKTFELKYTDLKRDMLSAPNKKIALKNSDLIVKFPNESGGFTSFKVKQMPVMHPDLAKKYPNNKSYIGVAVGDASKKVRFSINEEGLHAMIIGSDRKVQYIDPVSSDKKYYKVYKREDMNFDSRTFQCLTKNINLVKKASLAAKASFDLKLRTFRLALAATGEYSQFHIDRSGLGLGTDAEKKAAVLAAMTTAMTRVNAVFENDLAIHMELVANTDDLIYLNATTDPYTNDNGELMLGENQTTCDNVIGSANYDIGHVFSTGGGGVANRASICTTTSKAKGVTGSLYPLGDLFYFDFVAHEMGHQLGANHTFNGDAGNCAGGTRVDATAVEPGSGSTLMAYAGLCSPQNVQSHSDLYFHIVSVDEIWANIKVGGGTCANTTNLTTNLNVPVVNAGVNFVIPKSTPYVLKGQGSDADGDPISFCWEQIDNEITDIPPKETSTVGALYRSVNPKTSASRYLPELSTIVNGGLSSTWEVTPAIAREMNFKLTIRDNNIETGQMASDDLLVTVTDAAGPFSVTSQNVVGLVWNENTSELITWDVAGTTSNGVNVSKVNILMSMDGGRTFPVVLLANTINDGSQNITVPNTPASKCFVMVQAVGNSFYSVNKNVFSIGEFKSVCTIYGATDTPASIPDNDPVGLVSSINIAEDLNIEKIIVNVKINHTYVSDVTLTLESPDGTVVELLSGACDASNDIDVTFDDSGSELVCLGTPVVSGIIKPSQALFAFNGESSIGTWKLKVVDGAVDDNGSLESWSMEICTSEPVLGVNNYVFSNFKVYPNPSNGIFRIEFNSKNTSDVEINLFDVMGRNIYKKKFEHNSPVFSESVAIQGIASGIYILQVKRGNEISSQKLQIN